MYINIIKKDLSFTLDLLTLLTFVQSAESKYGIIFKTFSFSLIRSILGEKKTHYNSKFSWLAILLKHFFKIKIQPNISEQEKTRQRIYDLLNAETKPKKYRNNWSFLMASINPRH